MYVHSGMSWQDCSARVSIPQVHVLLTQGIDRGVGVAAQGDGKLRCRNARPIDAKNDIAAVSAVDHDVAVLGSNARPGRLSAGKVAVANGKNGVELLGAEALETFDAGRQVNRRFPGGLSVT